MTYFFGIGDLDIASYADNNMTHFFSSELGMTLKKFSNYIMVS